MWSVRSWLVIACVAVSLPAVCALAQSHPDWKRFTNRSGWSINYPYSWQTASCKSCKDLHAPDAFVNFFPPRMRNPTEGWVMVEFLSDKPVGTSVGAWLMDISKHTNVDAQLYKQQFTLNGLPALRVRYRAANGDQMESVYIASGLKTFIVHFSGDLDGGNSQRVPVDKMGNYPTYLKMLNSFSVD
jgi:hypothetical protein